MAFLQWEWGGLVTAVSVLMIADNLATYWYIDRNPINDLLMPCSRTLALVQFMFGVVNVIAFSSFYVQIDLILSDGVDPAHLRIRKWLAMYPLSDDRSWIETWRDRIECRASVFWFASSDSYIRKVTACGICNGLLMSILASRCLVADPSFLLFLLYGGNARRPDGRPL